MSCSECEQIKKLLDSDYEPVRRQVHRQAAIIRMLCKRLKDNGLSDSIEENEKPKLGETNV